MSKVLVIKGHPLTARESVTVKALDAFVAAYHDANPQDTIETVDVFNDPVPEIDSDIAGTFAAFKVGAKFADLTVSQQQKLTRFSELTDQFIAADKVVIANPLWNLSIPTKLKAWIDTIQVAGKTFKYTQEGPVGLMEDKDVLHIQAQGGIYEGDDLGSAYLETVLNFIGVENIAHIYIEGHHFTPEREEEIIATGIAELEEVAKEF